MLEATLFNYPTAKPMGFLPNGFLKTYGRCMSPQPNIYDRFSLTECQPVAIVPTMLKVMRVKGRYRVCITASS